MNLFDSHAHYNDEKFDLDREEIIKETLENNVSNFIIAGYNLKSSKKAVGIAKDYKEAYVIIGISPNDIEDIKSEQDIVNAIDELEKIYIEENLDNNDKSTSNNSSIVAIGEIGLDYYWTKENKEIQQQVFIKQIELANKLKLPIVIHTREAVNDTLKILKEHPVLKRGVFHCCPLNRELVKEGLKIGYYISLSGVITFKNVKNADEILKSPIIKRGMKLFLEKHNYEKSLSNLIMKSLALTIKLISLSYSSFEYSFFKYLISILDLIKS